MTGALYELFAAVLLAGTLLFAVTRPARLPEAVFAVPAAAVLLLSGALPLDKAWGELGDLGPTIGFLGAVLVLADLCDRHGLFEAAGTWMAKGSRGKPVALLALVFAITSSVTAVLSLDATVVLLTPVVLATVARLALRARPHAYACTHLANSASLLLPVSNLTNLLAFRASGLSFARFGATMALPWVAAIAVEWVVLRRFFAAELTGRGRLETSPSRPAPLFACAVVGLTLVGFFLAPFANIDPAFVALAGAVVLGVRALRQSLVSAAGIASAIDIPFLAFVFALGLIVKALSLHGLGSLVAHLVPGGASLWSLFAEAGIAAVLANVMNNLPAVLLLLPAAAAIGAPAVLAVLVGVNAGPNLTYFGSLATLLWKRVLHQRGERVAVLEFSHLGALSVPLVLLASTLALWLSLKLVR
ncbi:MAG TPA: SLC13 family permease [Acidimicrobiales bacterium]|nr:SLC13 family permease [Acidimicrobiales bacterium]